MRRSALIPMAIVALQCWAFAAGPAGSHPEEWRNQRWLIRLGAFSPTYATRLALENASGELIGGTLEDLVGLTSRINVFRLDASYQVSHREWWNATYFRSDRSATLTLQQDVQIGDLVFVAGSGVRSYVTEDQLQITYQNRVYANGRFGADLSAGLYISKFGAGVDTIRGSTLAEDVAATAPLPVVGLALDYKISPAWEVLGQFEGLKLKIGAIDGEVLDTRLSVQYMDPSGWGGGVGVNYRRLQVRARTQLLDGVFRYEYRGPFAFVSYRF